MSTATEKLTQQIQALSDAEKIELIEVILRDLEKPDPGIDQIWADEARKRWSAYKAGRLATVSYEEVMSRHRRQ